MVDAFFSLNQRIELAKGICLWEPLETSPLLNIVDCYFGMFFSKFCILKIRQFSLLLFPLFPLKRAWEEKSIFSLWFVSFVDCFLIGVIADLIVLR